MLLEERRRVITDHVLQHGRAEVGELSVMLGVSRMTVRRDLAVLASSGVLNRAWGGAVTPNVALSTETPYAVKRRENEETKRRIGQRAASLVGNGEVLILDAGSTTLHIATHLRGKQGLTVITNDLKIAVELASLPGVTLITPGGVAQPDSFTLLGAQTESFLGNLRVHRTFLGADAVDLERGASTRTLQEVSVKRAMMAAAGEIVLVVDHTKFGRQAFAAFCRLEESDLIVTDHDVPADVLRDVSDRVSVIQA